MKRMFIGTLAALALAGGPALADFPEKDINGIIQWGAGGSTDLVARSVTPHAAEVLGGNVVMQNMTGGVGVIALKYVLQQPADGYTLLYGAENPQLYKVLGLGTEDYGDYIPINVLARGVPIIVASPDAPYDDFDGLVEYAQANPGEVRVGSTGPGGLPSVVTSVTSASGGPLSIGCPSALTTRPSNPGPTGTSSAPPVATAVLPARIPRRSEIGMHEA